MTDIASLISLLPNAKSAPDYEAAGGTWAPEFQAIISSTEAEDHDGWTATRETFEKYGADAVAFSVTQDMGLHVEVCFERDGKEAVKYWNDRIDQLHAAARGPGAS